MNCDKPTEIDIERLGQAERTLNVWLSALRVDLRSVEAPDTGEALLRRAMREHVQMVAPGIRMRRWPLGLAASLLVGFGIVLGAIMLRPTTRSLVQPSMVRVEHTSHAGLPVYQSTPFPGNLAWSSEQVDGLAVLRVRLPVMAQDARTGHVQPAWIETDVLVGADGLARAIRTDSVARADPAFPVKLMEEYQ